ncbi:unnamed protein product [Trichobilharzia szidati]|nr:unnamed protein product [Trichobilharzia szidati]
MSNIWSVFQVSTALSYISSKSESNMESSLYQTLETYNSENIIKASVLASVWLSYQNKSMTFDEVLTEAGNYFQEYTGLEDSNKYPIVVEIKPSGGPACESLFTLYRRLPGNQQSNMKNNNASNVFISEWPKFPVYVKHLNVESIQQDEFIARTAEFSEQLINMNVNFSSDPYYWIIYNEGGDAEIWIKAD